MESKQFLVKGYDNFVKFMDKFKEDSKLISILFTGEKVDGVSWCSDCNDAEPFIKESIEKFENRSNIIIVDVGDRPTWKDTNNGFRKDPNTRLMVIPTLIRWKQPQRLEGEQLLKPELLEMFFTDED
ncbi:unnamed protein product [Diamesa serratosioi]